MNKTNRHELVLKHYWRSSCSWRVRWVLALKGLAYQSVPVDLLKGEHRQQAYTNANPSAFVPTLYVDGTPYSESLAIIEWLEESYPHNQLLPNDPTSRLIVRQLAYMIAVGVQPLQNMSAQQYYSIDPQERQAYAQHYITTGFRAYEQRLNALGAATYSFGANLTLADICLIPQVYNAIRFACDMRPYPHIMRIYQTCRQLQSCHISSPSAHKP